jgi:uncharacterized protein YjbJ (UPF0337 family)
MGDRIDEMKGNVKEGWGKLTGDRRTEAEDEAEADAARAKRETKGALEEAGGHIKEGIGHALGDRSLEAEGKADRLRGAAKRND